MRLRKAFFTHLKLNVSGEEYLRLVKKPKELFFPGGKRAIIARDGIQRLVI